MSIFDQNKESLNDANEEREKMLASSNEPERPVRPDNRQPEPSNDNGVDEQDVVEPNQPDEKKVVVPIDIREPQIVERNEPLRYRSVEFGIDLPPPLEKDRQRVVDTSDRARQQQVDDVRIDLEKKARDLLVENVPVVGAQTAVAFGSEGSSGNVDIDELRYRVSLLEDDFPDPDSGGETGASTDKWSFKVTLSGDVVTVAKGYRCVHTTSGDEWSEVASVEFDYADGKSVYFTWTYSTVDEDGVWGDVEYGYPPTQDEDKAVVIIATTTDEQGVVHRHVGDVRIYDIRKEC